MKEVYFMKKYELTDETKEFDGKTLYRKVIIKTKQKLF